MACGMACTAIVEEGTCQPQDVNEPRPLFSRRAVDPDAGLVEQLRRQDAEAGEALVAAYWDRAYRLAIRITGNASDAEEVVQDALWKVSRRIDTFRGGWRLRLLAVSDHRQYRLPEATAEAGQTGGSIVGGPCFVIWRQRPAPRGGDRLV